MDHLDKSSLSPASSVRVPRCRLCSFRSPSRLPRALPLLHTDAEQSPQRRLCDHVRHFSEHVISHHLILNQRISLPVSLKSDTLTELIHIIDMIHPSGVDDLQQNDTLHFTQLFRFRELSLFRLVGLYCPLFKQMLKFLLRISWQSSGVGS